MKVAFLTRGVTNTGSTRVRVLQYLEALGRLNIQTKVLARPSKHGRISHGKHLMRAMQTAVWADLLVLQKPNQSEKLIDLLARVNPNLVIDIDDAVWAPPLTRSGQSAETVSERQRTRFIHAVRRAGFVITGSQYLANSVKRFCPEATVQVIPSSVDMNVYQSVKKVVESNRITIGWIGNPGNFSNLIRILPVLRSLHREFNIKFVVVSSHPPEFNGLPVEFERWSVQTEIESLLRFDIGIMPLDTDERSLGRCGYKAIQYMAVGLPVISSPYGAGAEVVENDVTGFHATTTAEWETRLRMLITNKELRKTLGERGRQKVTDSYSVQANVERLMECFRRRLLS